jgi:hypothetical protein
VSGAWWSWESDHVARRGRGTAWLWGSCTRSLRKRPPLVPVLVRGKPQVVLDVGRVLATVERDGELHVVSFQSGYIDGEGWDYADWSVTAITPDGRMAPAITHVIGLSRAKPTSTSPRVARFW